MGVTISASHPEGHEVSHRYAEVDGKALTTVIRALCAEMDDSEGNLHPMPDPDDYAFYGASLTDARPKAFRDALQRVLAKEDADVREAIDTVGLELLVTLHEPGQLIWLDVQNARSGHFATVSTTGVLADEPTIECTESSAAGALAAYGLKLPDASESHTYRAIDIASKPTPRVHCADRLKQVAEYALRAFGPAAEIVVH